MEESPAIPNCSTAVPTIKKHSTPVPLTKIPSPPATLVKKRWTPPPMIKKRSVSAKTPQGGLSSFTRKLSARNLYAIEMKTGDYEAMLRKFKLRKLTPEEKPSFLFTRANSVVIDKPIGDKETAHEKQRFSLGRLLYNLSKRTTWIRAWRSLKEPIMPGSVVARLHDLLMLAVYHFQLYYLPFSRIYFPNGSFETTCVGMVTEIVFIVHILLSFNTGFIDGEEVVTSRNEIARNYLSKWSGMDIFSAIPFYITYCLCVGSYEHVPKTIFHHETALIMFRLLRLGFREHNLLFRRIFKISKRMAQQFQYSRYSNLLKIAKLLWFVVVLAHYMACFWRGVAQNHFDSDRGVGEQWAADFHRVIGFIQGDPGNTGTWEENVFASTAMMLGSINIAIVFGNVAMLVANFNANADTYHQKMESVFDTMGKMELPPPLQERVHQYYTHVWTEYKSLDGDIARFRRELAHSLELEVGVYKYMPVVNRIPYWEGCSQAFAMQIVLHLGVRVYMPNDYVVRKGETGDEMFLINRGVCEVCNAAKQQKPAFTILSRAEGDQDDEDEHANEELEMESSDEYESDEALEEETPVNGQSALRGLGGKENGEAEAPKKRFGRALSSLSLAPRTASSGRNSQVRPQKNSYEMDPGERKKKKRVFMYPGKGFGEMSLLMNYSRTANIRAATYVDICVFKREDFQRILTRFPRDRRRVLTAMLENCIDKKEIPFPWDQIQEAVAERRTRKGLPDPEGTTITAIEAARALVERIDVDVPDETIKYGFQSFKTNLSDYPTPTPGKTPGKKKSLGRRRSNARLVTQPRRRSHNATSADNEEDSSDTGSIPGESAAVQASRIDSLEATLKEVLGVVSSMAITVQQLNQTVENLNQTVERFEKTVAVQSGSHSCIVQAEVPPPGHHNNLDCAVDSAPTTSDAGSQTTSGLSAHLATAVVKEDIDADFGTRKPVITKLSPPRDQIKSQKTPSSASTSLRRIQSSMLEGIANKMKSDEPPHQLRGEHIRVSKESTTTRGCPNMLAPLPAASLPSSTQHQLKAGGVPREKVTTGEALFVAPDSESVNSHHLAEAVVCDKVKSVHAGVRLSRTVSPNSPSGPPDPELLANVTSNSRKLLRECGKSRTSSKITEKSLKLAPRSSLPSNLHETISAAVEAVDYSPRSSAATQVARRNSSRSRQLRRSAAVAVSDLPEPDALEEKAAPPASPDDTSEDAGSVPMVLDHPPIRENDLDLRDQNGDPTAEGYVSPRETPK